MMILTTSKTTQNSLEVKDPALSHARKCPWHYEDGTAEPYHPPDVKQHYKQIYFRVLIQPLLQLKIVFSNRIIKHTRY